MAASIANAVDDQDLGVAGAAQQMMSTLGTVTGTQVLFTVQQSQSADGLAGSFRMAYLVGAGVCVLGVVAATFVRRTQRSGTPAEPTSSGPVPTRNLASEPA